MRAYRTQRKYAAQMPTYPPKRQMLCLPRTRMTLFPPIATVFYWTFNFSRRTTLRILLSTAFQRWSRKQWNYVTWMTFKMYMLQDVCKITSSTRTACKKIYIFQRVRGVSRQWNFFWVHNSFVFFCAYREVHGNCGFTCCLVVLALLQIIDGCSTKLQSTRT